MDYQVAIDPGSTSLNAVVYDLVGNSISSAGRPIEKSSRTRKNILNGSYGTPPDMARHCYGWYSNKLRGQRDKRPDEKAQAAGQTVDVADVCGHKPRRIPSAKWRELIKKVWEADPLLCPGVREIRIVALLDDRAVTASFPLLERKTNLLRDVRGMPEHNEKRFNIAFGF